MLTYPAKYADRHGEFETTICNDGKTLRMNVRDIEFSGSSFDTFMQKKRVSESNLKLFSFDNSAFLCDYKLECEIPVQVFAEGIDLDAKLLMKLELGKVTEKGWVEKLDLSLALKYQGFDLSSQGNSGWFEEELIDIQKQLPNQQKLKNCFGCAFSDYSVYGHQLFGDMLCFRNIKEKYRKVFDKETFMEIMDEAERTVQETYLCSEFEVRKVAYTGYRG